MIIRYNVSKLIMWSYRGKVLYPYVLFKDAKDDVEDWLFRHELEHIYQVQRDGWFKFHAKYLYWLARYGYKNNPYEIEARKVQSRKLTIKERKLKNG